MNSPDETPATVELRLSATPSNVAVARQAVYALADACGWDPEFVDDVRLALSEACTNVVQHAYRNAGSPGEMLVSLAIEADTLRVAVRDRGEGIANEPDPDRPQPADGLGLGFRLIRTLAESVVVTSSEGSTEVGMAFATRAIESVA